MKRIMSMRGIRLVRSMVLSISIWLSIWPAHTLAQTTSDLSAQLLLSPAKPLYYAGDNVSVAITIRNSGPAAAAGAVFSMNSFAFGNPANAQVYIFPSVGIQPCFWDQVTLEPGTQGSGVIRPFVYFPSIAAGDSTTCYVELVVATQPSGTYVVGGQALPSGGSSDTNAVNNSANQTMAFGTFQAEPASIPTLGRVSICITLLIIAAVATNFLRRSS
jgi:hypothetical protein